MAFMRPDGHFYIAKKPGELVEKMIQEGFHIIFLQSYVRVTFTQECFAEFKLPKHENIKYIMVERRMPKLVVYLNLYLKAIKALYSVDFLYLFYPDQLAFLCLGAKLLKIPYGLYIRGSLGVYNKISRYFYTHADLCCTVSPELTNFVNKYNRRKAGKTISPLIDFSLTDSIIRDFSKPSVFKILYIGRLVEDKGINELIRAVEKLDKRYTFELHLVGDGPLLSKLSKDKLLIESNVIFHGHISNTSVLKHFYCDCDILCLPSYHEGFPRVLYEAMIFKLPIVTTFVGTIPYLMKDNVNCLEILPKSTNSIVEKLSYLMDNYEAIRSLLVENAYNTVRDYLLQNNLSHFSIIANYLWNK